MKNIDWLPAAPLGDHMPSSTDTTTYLVSLYTFHLKQLACIFIWSEVIQFLSAVFISDTIFIMGTR
jgi:hypothetical protein